MIAPIDKIKNLTTEDVISLFGEDILNSCFEEAFKFTNNLITDNSCYEALVSSDLETASYRTTSSSGGGTTALGWNDDNYLKNRRILFANREIKDSSPSVYLECAKLDSNISTTSASISTSIYYEYDPYTPKYYITNAGKLQIIPLDTGSALPTAEIYYMTYPRFGEQIIYSETHKLGSTNFSDIQKEAEHTLFYGIPIQARELVYIQMALNLIQYYMSDFVHEEEDTELSNLLASQVVSLDKDRKELLQFVVTKFGVGNMGDVK